MLREQKSESKRMEPSNFQEETKEIRELDYIILVCTAEEHDTCYHMAIEKAEFFPGLPELLASEPDLGCISLGKKLAKKRFPKHWPALLNLADNLGYGKNPTGKWESLKQNCWGEPTTATMEGKFRLYRVSDYE